MARGDSTRVRGAGRDGSRATRPVSDPPQGGAQLLGTGDREVRASEKSIRTWETAYRQYGHAWETTARCGRSDPTAARDMAAASWAVAAAWRQIASATRLPWWVLAALESAAGAFESQAREYEQGQPSEGP
jgi:hypothetical protein